MILVGLFIALVIVVNVATVRAVVQYLAKEIARENRKNNGELARAIVYELMQAQLEDEPEED